MPQLIGFVIVVVLALFALTAIAGLIYSALLWGPVLGVCWLLLDQVQQRRIAAFADPAVRARLAQAGFARGQITISVKQAEVQRYMDLGFHRAIAIIAGMAAVVVAMAVLGRRAAYELANMLPQQEAFQNTAVFGAMVGPYLFILIGTLRMHKQAKWNSVATQRLEERLRQGTAPLDTLREIEQIQKHTDALMQRLTGTTTAGVLAQASRIVQDNIAALFSQTEQLQQQLQASLVPARQQLQRLQAFANAVDEARQLHGQVVRLAMHRGHRSLMSLAEDARAVIEAAPRFLLAEQFDKAEQHLALARQELDTALADPDLFGDDSDSDADDAYDDAPLQDCYARLRIDSSVTAQQLEDLRKRLRQTYHPDKGIADHHAYQAVRDDIDAVARDLGFTLRGFND